MTERMFTVEEANALLPELRRSLDAIRHARHQVLEGAEPFRGRAATNGGGEQSPEYWDAMSTLREELEGLIASGIVLRDAESGLVDFPATVDGREVFLCWRPDEDRVGYWHGPESGFAGRRPL
jgi:hypothetical protein